ncbi:hypothetical protein [Haladaptatus caseinilyticus]|uniref:hypothetical protein n=1 Tax=Haladaptatus caseinilyticus TaxID=2993314 RepID=UPI00224AB50A|nr:hypothetical protein [Haladaptatus caseinilyticus]
MERFLTRAKISVVQYASERNFSVPRWSSRYFDTIHKTGTTTVGLTTAERASVPHLPQVTDRQDGLRTQTVGRIWVGRAGRRPARPAVRPGTSERVSDRADAKRLRGERVGRGLCLAVVVNETDPTFLTAQT